jgi:hypothetical protein
MGRLRLIPDPVARLGQGLQVFSAGLTYLQRVQALSPIAYWPLNEPAGTSGAGSVLDYSGNARHATPTSVTFGATGIGDGNTAATFNGSSSLIDVYSVSLFASAFTLDTGSIIAWVKGDPQTARILNFAQSSGNQILIERSTTGINFYRMGGGTLVSTVTTTFSALAPIAMTWSVAADQLIGYANGTPVAPTTGLVSSSTALTLAKLGSHFNGTPFFFAGTIAHVACFNYVLSSAQIASLAAI